MINKHVFYEIMGKPSDKTISLVMTLDKMFNYTSDVKLIFDDENKVVYQVDANKIMEKDLEMHDLMELNQGGWVLSKDKRFLNLYL